MQWVFSILQEKSFLPVDVSNNAAVKTLDSSFILKHCLVLIPQNQSIFLKHSLPKFEIRNSKWLTSHHSFKQF